jgi:hypothetical protein
MNTPRPFALRLSLCLLLGAVLGGCAVEGGDYGGGPGYADVGVGLGYGGDYYEPCCYGYGGWGPGYFVGPPGGGYGYGHGWDHGHGGGPGYGGGRGGGAPSIPSHPRGGGHGGGFGGGGHGGGGHGGGGGHH